MTNKIMNWIKANDIKLVPEEIKDYGDCMAIYKAWAGATGLKKREHELYDELRATDDVDRILEIDDELHATRRNELKEIRRQLVDIFGHSEEEVKGKTWSVLAPKLQSDVVNGLIGEFLK